MQAGRYVYTNGWGRNTSLGLNNGDGKMIVMYGPVFDGVRRDAVDTKARCTHRYLVPTWMAIWKRRAGRLLLYASTCSFAVRPMFLAKIRKASLQQRARATVAPHLQ
jgi:hypothetical protein